MVYFGPFLPDEVRLVHLGRPTVLWPLLNRGLHLHYHPSKNHDKVAQEPKRKRKTESSEQCLEKHKDETEPSELFVRKRKRSWNPFTICILQAVKKHKKVSERMFSMRWVQ